MHSQLRRPRGNGASHQRNARLPSTGPKSNRSNVDNRIILTTAPNQRNTDMQVKKRRYNECDDDLQNGTMRPTTQDTAPMTKVLPGQFATRPPNAYGPPASRSGYPAEDTSSRAYNSVDHQTQSEMNRGIQEMTGSALDRGDGSLDISSYLPEAICQQYKSLRKSGKLFEWQMECLGCRGVLDGASIVYCAPTSAGKSLVAEILLLRKLTLTNKAAMLVLPFVALCSEKAAHLDVLLKPTEMKVRRFYGSQNSPTIFREDTGVLVCTIEKANTLVNRMIEDEVLDELGIVVVDELHMVDDPYRGYLLELLLTKLRYMSMQRERKNGLQIVGMSATMPNSAEVAQWLGAELYVTQTRPIPLRQYLKVGTSIRDESGQIVRTLNPPPDWINDPDHVAWLTKETVDNGHSVLIFCCSKKVCEICAQQIAQLLDVPVRVTKRGRRRESFLAELQQIVGEYPEILINLIRKGIAFHHAGLSSEERELVESAYKNGAVSVLTATSTLAAGVNLPARRVIFKEPYVGLSTNVLNSTSYRQMAGRAGRAGIDEEGEAYLIESKFVKTEILQKLIQCDAQPVSSCLGSDRNGMVRLLLDVISNGAVRTGKDIERLVRSTLLAQKSDSVPIVDKAANDALKWLNENRLISWIGASDEIPGMWSANALSQAIVNSGMDPRECTLVKKDLLEATRHLILSSDLQLTYLVTPYNVDIPVDWEKLYRLVDRLNAVDVSIFDLVGGSMVFLQRCNMGAVSAQNSDDERIARRFYAALILREVINEVPLSEICTKFKLSLGVIETLQEKACRYANMSASFCGSLGWVYLQVLIVEFQKRIFGGARPEIVHLTEIPFVKAHRARLLYKAGFKTVEAIAGLRSLERLARVIAIDNHGVDNDQENFDLHIAKKIVSGARAILREKLTSVEEETKVAAEIVREESVALTETNDAPEAINRTDAGIEHDAARTAPAPAPDDGELTASLRRLSFDPKPFIETQGIVVLHTQAEVRTLSQYLKSSTTGPISFQSNLLEGEQSTTVGIAICWSEHVVAYIPLSEDAEEKLQYIAAILEVAQIQIVTFLLLESMEWLQSLFQARTLSILSTVVDVHRAAKLLRPMASEANDLAGLFVLFGQEAAFQEIKDFYAVSAQDSFSQFRVLPCCSMAALTRRIWAVLQNELDKAQLQDFFLRISMPHTLIIESLNSTALSMTREGVLLLISKLDQHISQLSEQCRYFAGVVFDPLSNQQTDEILLDKLQLTHLSSDTAKEGDIWLRSLQDQHPLPAVLLSYRHWNSVHHNLTSALNASTEIDHDKSVLSSNCGMNLIRYFGRRVWLRGDLFHDMLQNCIDDESDLVKNLPLYDVIVSDGNVQMSPLGSDKAMPSFVDICSHIESQPDCDILLVTYEHLDLWLLAFLSQDQNLISALVHANGNPFKSIARLMTQTDFEKADKISPATVAYIQRFISGFLVGVSPLLSARLLQVSEKRALDSYDGFIKLFTGIGTWLQQMVKGCQQNPEIRSVYGQRIPVDDGDFERTALRTILQSSASDILKSAAIQIYQKLQHQQASILLQTKQGFVIEVLKTTSNSALQLIQEAMADAAQFDLPVPVPIHFSILSNGEKCDFQLPK